MLRFYKPRHLVHFVEFANMYGFSLALLFTTIHKPIVDVVTYDKIPTNIVGDVIVDFPTIKSRIIFRKE